MLDWTSVCNMSWANIVLTHAITRVDHADCGPVPISNLSPSRASNLCAALLPQSMFQGQCKRLATQLDSTSARWYLVQQQIWQILVKYLSAPEPVHQLPRKPVMQRRTTGQHGFIAFQSMRTEFTVGHVRTSVAWNVSSTSRHPLKQSLASNSFCNI